ncbi:unnamed protein product [Heterobilharzia americana]|nr:unnamed protein product [Heterobilharzia americana]
MAVYSELNRLIEMAVNDIQEKQETMNNMEKSFISSSEEFKKTIENLYSEMELKLSQEEETMSQRLEKVCEEMKNNANQIIEEKEEQTENLKEKLKQLSTLSDDLQRETEDDRCTMEEARKQCQNILDEIEEYEQLIDESKANVKELQMKKKAEHMKKDKEAVNTCQKIQEEREALVKKLNELKEINRCLRDLGDEKRNDTSVYDTVLSPEVYKVKETNEISENQQNHNLRSYH